MPRALEPRPSRRKLPLEARSPARREEAGISA